MAFVFIGIWGAGWLTAPTLLPPLVLSWVLLLAPYFVMMPGMDMGIADARTPSPNTARLKSAASHSIFGLGMAREGADGMKFGVGQAVWQRKMPGSSPAGAAIPAI
jgi:hypothetical protein